jgi:hypothetical protein
MRGISSGLMSLAICGILSVGFDIGDAGATVSTGQHDVTLASHAMTKSKARAECQADGATVSVAIAAFESNNPGKFPTMAELVSSAHHGPYLQRVPKNTYYKFSINSHGVLKIATAKSLGPPIVYRAPVPFEGPSSCAMV